jgi:hypothetical protein
MALATSYFWDGWFILIFVGQVKFTPDQQSKLISAAVDGLICVFDTDGDIDDDNHLLSVCIYS